MTDLPPYLPFDLDAVVAEEGAPAAGRVVAGDPRHRTWVVEAREADRQWTGVWESTPGAWRVLYDEWEFCSILSGRSRLHEDGAGAPRELGPGDSFILRPGFSGIWEVVETTRKLFVVRLL